jgi:hypothetical protein
MSASIGSREPRHERSRELAVRIPLVFQIVTAAGDRYLAANLAGFRVLVSESYRMDLQELRLQAQLQRDVSWLNPAHEDNYYIAAAILSLPELIPAAQFILRRAADARPRDWQPLFYYGFNRYFFEKNPAAGAQGPCSKRFREWVTKPKAGPCRIWRRDGSNAATVRARPRALSAAWRIAPIQDASSAT